MIVGTVPAIQLRPVPCAREEEFRLYTRHITLVHILSIVVHRVEAIAREWHTTFLPTWKPEYVARIQERPEADTFP